MNERVNQFIHACRFLTDFNRADPLQVVNLIRDLDTDFSILGKNYVNIIQVSSHLLAMSSTCYNPFIYASLHNKFLSYLCRHLLSRWRRKGKDGGQGSSVLTMSHRVLRRHTSSMLAGLPAAGGNNPAPPIIRLNVA